MRLQRPRKEGSLDGTPPFHTHAVCSTHNIPSVPQQPCGVNQFLLWSLGALAWSTRSSDGFWKSVAHHSIALRRSCSEQKRASVHATKKSSNSASKGALFCFGCIDVSNTSTPAFFCPAVLASVTPPGEALTCKHFIDRVVLRAPLRNSQPVDACWSDTESLGLY